VAAKLDGAMRGGRGTYRFLGVGTENKVHLFLFVIKENFLICLKTGEKLSGCLRCIRLGKAFSEDR
jgi:hypothetical protein